MDIDLAGRTSNELHHIRSVITALCELTTEPDGLEFDPASIEVQRIKEDAEYEGVRVRFQGTLAKARIPMQIDIGFGDVIVPKPVDVEYPAMLEFPPPVLRSYPKETVVAEKLEALTVLGMLNSRIKDYYDVALLARLYPFDGALLVEAIHSTFRHRGTTLEANPVGLTDAFTSDPARAAQWRVCSSQQTRFGVAIGAHRPAGTSLRRRAARRRRRESFFCPPVEAGWTLGVSARTGIAVRSQNAIAL